MCLWPQTDTKLPETQADKERERGDERARERENEAIAIGVSQKLKGLGTVEAEGNTRKESLFELNRSPLSEGE